MLGHAVWMNLRDSCRAFGSSRESADILAAKCHLFKGNDGLILGNVDVLKDNDLKNVFDIAKPDVVVNCVGLVKQLPHAGNPVSLMSLNSFLPHRLAEICEKHGTRLIHLSTDCVFSGKKGNYSEDDLPDADDLYGRTKYLGEVTGKNCLTIRTSIVGRQLSGKGSLFEWFLSQKGKVKGFRKAVFSGLTTYALADVIRTIIEDHPGLEGMYHVSGSAIDKYDLLNRLKRSLNLEVEITPDDSVVLDKSLDSAKFRKMTGIRIPGWDDMIEDFVGRVQSYEKWRYGDMEINERRSELIFQDKKILITGGTGSLGQKLVSRILQGKNGMPSRIRVFSRDEAKQHHMRLKWKQKYASTDEVIYRVSDDILEFQIGDIRNIHSVKSALKDIDIVINAAAMKQVPTCEYFPFEAVQTNIHGAHNIVTAIAENGLQVDTVVGVSTDKACKPVNVMGMTKSIQERVFIEWNLKCPQTRFLCTRYGNVLASRGSVIPLFIEQIRRGGPVTITTSEMTRFLMSLDGAIDIIFAAIRDALPGETYIPKIPSARISDVVDVMVGGRKLEIQQINIRPGEKTHEVLVSEEECHRTVNRGDHYVIQPLLPELRAQDCADGCLTKEYTSADNLMSKDEIRDLLRKNDLLPEEREVTEQAITAEVEKIRG